MTRTTLLAPLALALLSACGPARDAAEVTGPAAGDAIGTVTQGPPTVNAPSAARAVSSLEERVLDAPITFVDPPIAGSLAELVGGTMGTGPYDAIVIGTLDDYLGVGMESTPEGWDDLATEEITDFMVESMQDVLGYTELRIKVERVLLDHGDIASTGAFVLRRSGAMKATPDPNESDVTSLYPHERPGERYLYFLTADEGGAHYYAVREWVSRIALGDYVAYSDGAREPVAFAIGTPVDAFVAAVETQIAISYATPAP